jgi:uncharacterized protein (DUF1800 family)
MRRQNDTFRRYARAKFGALLNAILREPALLIYLDAPANRKGHPNENLARELMELFTLGIGHYSEQDVKEAARALTGWGVGDDGTFQERPIRHDDGEKTILGKRGRWKAENLAQILLETPATAARLAQRICELFMGEEAVSTAAIQELARGLMARQLDINWAVETVLRSRAFFADENIGSRVLAPLEYVVGAGRALEMIDPPPSTLALTDWAARMGQDVFDPPNVGGWMGGRSWLTTRWLIARANYAAALVDGSRVGRSPPMDLALLATRHGHGDSRQSMIAFYLKLFGLEPAMALGLSRALPPGNDTRPETMREAVALALSMPEAQLG